jgi:6-pyruvoyltetrahydropterin/6-carboxytetrahydropterin synthase
MEIFKEFTFDSAHRLPNVRDGHKCSRLHGHTYKVVIAVAGPVGEFSGWVRDFADISTAWVDLHMVLDHNYLNEIDGLENPTSELLAVWIWDRIIGKLPDLVSVTVRETCTSGCVYKGPEA